MLILSYNYHNSGAENIIVLRNNRILELIILKNTNYKNKEEKFSRASISIAGKISKYRNENENILIQTPPMLSKNKQEVIINKRIKKNNSVKHGNKPLKICSAINSMIIDGRINSISNKNKSEPIRIYTDASVQENKQPTIGFAILNNDNQILYLYGKVLSGSKDIEDYELNAGIAGLCYGLQFGFKSVEWVSDNQMAQNVLNGQDHVGTEIQRESLRKIKSNYTVFEYKDIKGKSNRLADSLADDVRRNNLDETIYYTTPSFKRHLTN